MPYASRVDPTEDVRIVLADQSYCDALAGLVSRIEAEDHPNDAQAATRAPSGMAESLSRYDALSSDSAWFMIAYRSDQPAGLAVLTRVPKLDERTGFLYVDELHVLSEHRRPGIATALLQRACSLTRELGLAGISLLAQPDNRAARALYESLGFRGSGTMLYQLRLDRETP